VPSRAPLAIPGGTHGVVVATLPLSTDRSIQVVATHDVEANIKPLVVKAFGHVPASLISDAPEDAVFVVYGKRPEGTPWFSAVRYKDAAANQL